MSDMDYYEKERSSMLNTGYSTEITREELIGMTYFACAEFDIPLHSVKIMKLPYGFLGFCGTQWNKDKVNVRFLFQYSSKHKPTYGLISHEVGHAREAIDMGFEKYNNRWGHREETLYPYVSEIQSFIDVWVKKRLI
jgi:hypothetical protein